jgi:predicted nucleotidyltransferase
MGVKLEKRREKEIIDNVVSVLKEHLDPEKIILFGSRAKKKNSGTSDFDFAVDSKKVDIREYRKIKEKIEKFSGLYEIDVVFFSELDEDFKNIVLETGKTLYEKRT